MGTLIISGRIMKSVIIITMITLSLSLLGFFGSNSQAKDDAKLDNSIVEWIKVSELKIKRNIKKVTTLENGLNLYSFQYRSEPTTYVGFLAHELAASDKFKNYVVHMGEGFYTIHYEKMGFQTITYENWQLSGEDALKTTTDIAQKKTK